jgi:hypothetical protein
VCELALWISSLFWIFALAKFVGRRRRRRLRTWLELRLRLQKEENQKKKKKKNHSVSNCCEVGIKIDDNCRCLWERLVVFFFFFLSPKPLFFENRFFRVLPFDLCTHMRVFELHGMFLWRFLCSIYCCRRCCLYLSPSISHWFVLCRELFFFFFSFRSFCVCVCVCFWQGALGFVILSLFEEEEENIWRGREVFDEEESNFEEEFDLYSRL